MNRHGSPPKGWLGLRLRLGELVTFGFFLLATVYLRLINNLNLYVIFRASPCTNDVFAYFAENVYSERFIKRMSGLVFVLLWRPNVPTHVVRSDKQCFVWTGWWSPIV